MDNIYVIDLFCGCGGFSEGARQAGANVILAVDNWKEALDIHELNHPETTHWDTELGRDIEEFSVKLKRFISDNVPAGKHVHIHSSPPCQNLSAVNSKRKIVEGYEMIDWTIELMVRVSPTTWSLENVCHPNLYTYPNAFRFKMEDYGVPQSRRRVVICNGFDPKAIETSPVISAFDVLSQYNDRDVNWLDYEIMSSGSYNRIFRSIRKPCYTILWHRQAFRNKNDKSILTLSGKETSIFQTFPSTFHVGNGQMIANAVPPEFSRRLVSSLLTPGQ